MKQGALLYNDPFSSSGKTASASFLMRTIAELFPSKSGLSVDEKTMHSVVYVINFHPM